MFRLDWKQYLSIRPVDKRYVRVSVLLFVVNTAPPPPIVFLPLTCKNYSVRLLTRRFDEANERIWYRN